MYEYKKPTDNVHTITLDSKITSASWGQKIAAVGDKAIFFVQMHFIGNGSEIEIHVEDKKGKRIEKLKGQVFGNQFAGSIVIPEKAKEEITFTAKLPKHGLEMKSGTMIILPLIKVTNLIWGQKEARRGDLVKLTADIEGIANETEIMISIFEYDQDGAHDFITKFSSIVKNRKVKAEWEFEYHEDVDEIPTDKEMKKYGKEYNPPEYFWVVDVAGKRFGDKQESGLLEFKDWVEIQLYDEEGKPVSNVKYVLTLSDGTEKEGNLDQNGSAIENDISPGKILVSFPDLHIVKKYSIKKNLQKVKTSELIISSGKSEDFEYEVLEFSI